MRIKRLLEIPLKKDLLESGKIVVLYGARQTGKTTLSNDLLDGLEGKKLLINADELRYTDVLSSRNFQKMELLLAGHDILCIDEAQRIPEIGINLKIIYDKLPGMKILVTGSSSFELAGKVKEPLTGRTVTHTLFPVSLSEMLQHFSKFELQGRIEELMLYGGYPFILNLKSAHEKEKYLRELATAYLYRDVLELSNIRNSSALTNLLRILALQAGNEISLNELAQNLRMSQETVNAYIDLLEKSFILFRLKGFSRNLRKEISKRDKIFFWDLGIRNTLINNFSPLELRNDVGSLWENFIIAERLKHLSYQEIYASSWFWRTYTGAELDYIEEREGRLYAYEIKFRKARKKPPQTWVENYGAEYQCITSDNFWEFVTGNRRKSS